MFTYDILEDLGVTEEELTEAEMSFVFDAQLAKNKRLKKLKEEKESTYYKFHRHGILRSSALEAAYKKAEEDCAADCEAILTELTVRIRTLRGGDVSEGFRYPDNPDYSLDAPQRYYVVYDYYMEMTNPAVRFSLFQADTLAKEYLGIYYSTLYDRLRNYAGAGGTT